MIATEQYPKGLGPTVPHLSRHFVENPAAKTKFTMLVPEVLAQLKKWKKVDTVVLCGIETHVCILATCQDLRAEGLNVSEAMYEVFRRWGTLYYRHWSNRWIDLSIY